MSERVDVQQLRDLIDSLFALLDRLDALEEVAEAAEQLMPFLDANATVPERGRARLTNALIDVARLREGEA